MADQHPIAIIDIGSNSVRLVVYSGATRSPSVIFNEKVMAALGEEMSRTGELSLLSQERALAALRRFLILIKQMGVRRHRVVATAAVRDASNGADFLREVRRLGFAPEVLSGEDEGYMAGQGVLSGLPEADGLVGDLGGGSLELVDVADGEVIESVSLPLGVLRVNALAEKGEAAVTRKVAKALDQFDLRKRGKKRPFYMVGGSWRALARLDMHVTEYPLPVTHHYSMSTNRPVALQKVLEGGGKPEGRSPRPLSASRMPMLPHANLLLKALVEELKPSELIVSSYGIREGLIFDDLDHAKRRNDPLIASAREAGREFGRFAEHGALLDQWIAPIFDDDGETARLRLAACLLADVAWLAHPDFRAERGVDMALHGNWVGVDHPGRVMIAQALFCNFGGGRGFSDLEIAALCTPDELRRASHWGLAMRLGQRLSGGVAGGLERTRLTLRGDALRLTLRRGDEALCGEIVERRLKTLAHAFGQKYEVVTA